MGRFLRLCFLFTLVDVTISVHIVCGWGRLALHLSISFQKLQSFTDRAAELRFTIFHLCPAIVDRFAECHAAANGAWLRDFRGHQGKTCAMKGLDDTCRQISSASNEDDGLYILKFDVKRQNHLSFSLRCLIVVFDKPANKRF